MNYERLEIKAGLRAEDSRDAGFKRAVNKALLYIRVLQVLQISQRDRASISSCCAYMGKKQQEQIVAGFTLKGARLGCYKQRWVEHLLRYINFLFLKGPIFCFIQGFCLFVFVFCSIA